MCIDFWGDPCISGFQLTRTSEAKSCLAGNPYRYTWAGSCGAAFRVSGSGSKVLCQLLNLCWHWTGPLQGTRMGSSIPPWPPAAGSESHNCQIISVSFCLKHSWADYIYPQCKRLKNGKESWLFGKLSGGKRGFSSVQVWSQQGWDSGWLKSNHGSSHLPSSH